jgi:hypothetical protein
MTFEEQLTRETWIKEGTTHQHAFMAPLQKNLPKISGRDSLKGRAVTPQVLLRVFTQDYTSQAHHHMWFNLSKVHQTWKSRS